MRVFEVTGTLALIGVIALAVHAVKTNGKENNAVLNNAIVAFETVSCPIGWDVHLKSEGRFLVNAGQSGDEGKHKFELLSSGGKIVHEHTGTTSRAPASSGEDDNSHPRTSAHTHTFTTTQNSHLPPYYVVTFCKKV